MLPGGGARGAYQIGVLKALSEFLPGEAVPFSIVAGTSAGGINAAVLASHAGNFNHGVTRLENFWCHLHCDHIYRTGWLHNLATGAHWLASMTLGGLGIANPKSLLDNAPLSDLLHRELKTDGIRRAIQEGTLEALLITASGYATSCAVTFFQARPEIEGWSLYRRVGVRTAIQAEHLLASAALPLLFPAQLIGNEYFGDGGMRHTTPLSPPILMGADRLLVIGTRSEGQDPEPELRGRYPSLGDVGSYLLDVIFMDHLHNDLTRLRQINHILEHLPESQAEQTGFRNIETLLIQPSRDLREIANLHMHRVPASVKALMKGVGAWGPGRLPSYLLFEAEFCRELIALGYRDGQAARERLRAFMTT